MTGVRCLRGQLLPVHLILDGHLRKPVSVPEGLTIERVVWPSQATQAKAPPGQVISCAAAHISLPWFTRCSQVIWW